MGSRRHPLGSPHARLAFESRNEPGRNPALLGRIALADSGLRADRKTCHVAPDRAGGLPDPLGVRERPRVEAPCRRHAAGPGAASVDRGAVRATAGGSRRAQLRDHRQRPGRGGSSASVDCSATTTSPTPPRSASRSATAPTGDVVTGARSCRCWSRTRSRCVTCASFSGGAGHERASDPRVRRRGLRRGGTAPATRMERRRLHRSRSDGTAPRRRSMTAGGKVGRNGPRLEPSRAARLRLRLPCWTVGGRRARRSVLRSR